MSEPASQVRLYRQRASYDFAAARAIFAEAPVAHVAFLHPGEGGMANGGGRGKERAGTVMNVPLITVIMRPGAGEDDEEDEEGPEGWSVYFHTHAKSGLVEAVASGIESLTATTTIIDGLVFSPTAEDHSLNYRSATLHLADPVILPANSEDHFEDKQRSLTRVTNTVTGYSRTDTVGLPGKVAVDRTTVVRCALTAVSCKQRCGGWDSAKEPALQAEAGDEGRGWKGAAPCWTQFGAVVGYGADGDVLKGVLEERNAARRRTAEGSVWASDSAKIEGLGKRKKA